ncbi:dual specificity phosphatase, catalytic domain containing protein [Acanthamoeba castellanii str. Neff]|uniref:Dual specificity phosphatase, catalytic domain containing protein n=1 Tax=Acanthamoeba castellanii (strain ATCC 30010 / Neff) TaxID=1257118 RepID=L8H9X0_ACACF|nr:dual specificity phosphatase, catalytic domain containing protein [Acanthamoeba castellanii str. Neff]ELR22324.1 dual specificity phosphatase, catalytic domain containing protein [Acanthamoeba castellanii str. Neff]
MTSQLRKLVSKKKKRFAQEGFDLDLSYITDNVIAMGFPSDSVGGIYRNPRKEVIRMLDTYHENQYKVYNLCSERTYNHAIFYGRVSDFPIDDHNVPTMPMIRQFCEDAEQWLHQDEDNVIAVHCKAGKGRTGLMICCWLIHSQTCATSREAIELFGKERTKDRKGVTIPSQRRYIRYYELLLQHQLDPRDLPPPGQIPVVFLTEVRTNVIPTYDKSGANMRILLSDRSGNELYSDIAKYKVENKNPSGGLYFDCRSCPLKGDVRLLIFHKSTTILQLWFNTMFVTRTQLTFRKHELDKANKDKTHIPNNFTLTMVVTLPIKNPYFADVQEGEADLSSDSSQPATDDDDEGSDNDENHNNNNNAGEADEGEEHADDADDRERDAAAEASGNNRGRRGGSGIGSIAGGRPPKAGKKKGKKEEKKTKKEKDGQDGGKEKEEKRSRSLIKRFGRESENNVATKPRLENGDAVPPPKKWRLSLVAPTKIPKPRRRSSSLDESDSLMAPELGEFAPGQLIDAGILLGGLPYASSASDSAVVMKEDGHIEHSSHQHHISNGHTKKEKKNKEKEKKMKNNNNKHSPKKRPLTASASDLRHSSGSDVISVHSGSGHIAIGVPMSARDPEPSSHDKSTTNPRKHSSPAAVRRDTGGSSSPAQGSVDHQKTPERRASGLATLPALVAPAGSRRSPKGSGSARETGDHVDTNGGSAGRRAGEAENEYDEVGRGKVEGEEVAGPTLAELEAEEIGGDEDAKERESPGRRKVGLQANLRRLSVRLTNVPNIFSKSASVKPVREKEESSVVGGSVIHLSSSGTHGTPQQQQGGSCIVISSGGGGAGGGRDMINAAAAAADYAQGDEKPPKKSKRSRRKSRLSVNFDNLKKLTGLSHPDQMEKKPKQQFSKHARFDDRRLSTSAPSLVYPLMTTASSSSSLPAIEPADLSSTPNKHLCAIYGDDSYEDLDLDLDARSDGSSGSGSSSMADKAAAAFNQAAAAAGDFSSTPTTLSSLSSSPSSFLSASSSLTPSSSSSSSFMSPHHHHHLQQHQHHQQQQQLQARSKVSEIIDKWNAHGLKSREHHTEDALGVMRRGPGDRSEIAVRRFAAQAARGSYPAQANHNYPGLYGGSCNDLYTRSDPLLRSDDYYDTSGYSTSLPSDSVMAGMSMSTSPYSSGMGSLSCSVEGSLGESDEFAGAQSSRFRGWGKRQLTDPRRPRPRSLHAGEGTGNGDFERRRQPMLSVSGGAASPGPRPVGKVYMAAKALEPDPAQPASAPLLSSLSTSTTSSSSLSSSSLSTASFGPKSPTAAAKPPQSMRERVRAVVEKPRSGSLASSQPPSLMPSLSSPGGLSSPRTASPRLSLSSSSSSSSSPSPSRSSFASSSSVPINKKRAITVGLPGAKRGGGGGGGSSKEPLSARADNSWITLNSATSNAAALSSHNHLYTHHYSGRGRQRALSISSAVVAPVNLRKATSSATLSAIAPRDLIPMHAAANSFSTPLADFRESRDRRTDNRAQLWARLKGGGGGSGGSHSSLLADVANETGPEGVILPLIGRKRSSNSIGSGGSGGSEIRSARSGPTIHMSQSSIITASASASHSGGGSSDPQAFKKADEVSEAFRRTLESTPVPQVVDDRRRKWSFMSPGGGGGGSGIVSLAGRDREPTRKKTGGSIIGGFMGGGSGGGGGATQEEGASRGGRKGSWKAKLAPLIEVSNSNSSSSPVSPLGGRGVSCVTLGTRHDGDSVSVVSPSFYTPPPTSSPASASSSSLSLSSPGSGSSAAAPPLASTLAANARRKRAEEDAGVGVEALRQMLREKEQEAEEARKVMEAKQYEVRELKERLWEKLNFVEDSI